MLTLACLLGGLALAGLLGGCGSDTTAASGDGSGDLKVLQVAMEGAPYSTLDPQMEGLYYSIEDNVYDLLVRWDPEQKKAVPSLAQSWEHSPDGKTWTFHLVQGAKFHDGTDVDAEAVKFSLERCKKGQFAPVVTYCVKSFEVPDKYTVVVNLSSAQKMDFAYASACGTAIVSPTAVKKYGDQAFQPGNGAGSGPYVLMEATTTQIKLQRFDGYWGGWEGEKATAPDVAVMRGIDEPSARIQSLEQGESQIILGIPPGDMKSMETNSDFVTHSDAYWAQWNLNLNTQKKPLSDPYLREALYYAFPYQEVLDLVLGGYGSIATGPTMVGVVGYEQQAADCGTPTQDMAKARAALAKSAYAGGVTIDMPVESGKTWEIQAAQLYKAALEELGITLKAYPQNLGVTLDRAWSKNPPQDILAMSWPDTTPLPYESHYNMLAAPGPWNLSYYTNPQVTKLVNKGIPMFVTDEPSAISLFTEAWNITKASYPVLYTLNLEAQSANSTAIKGFDGVIPGYANDVRCYNISM